MSKIDVFEIKRRLDSLLQELWADLRTREQIKSDYDTELERLNAKYGRRRTRINTRIVKLRKRLAWLVKTYREHLMTAKLKSFTTELGVFEFRNSTTRFKVTDAAGALAAARKLGVVRKIAKLKVSWTIEPKKLEEFLRQHGEYINAFDEFVDPGGDVTEVLRVRPQSYIKGSDRQLKDTSEQLDPLPKED